MNSLRNFSKSVFAHISAKFKYFAEQFILTKSPDHVWSAKRKKKLEFYVI